MRQFFLQYLVVLAIFLAIDFVWLSTAGRTIYAQEIGGLLRDKPQLAVAFGFYLIYAAGLLVFVVEPGLQRSELWRTCVLGAFFGLVAYGTYDLTNLATLKGFTTRIAIIDMAWGAVLSGSVSVFAVWILRILKV